MPQRGVMPRHISLSTARDTLRTRDDLRVEGWRSRDIQGALADGSLRRVQRNRYISGRMWVDLWTESQHLLEVASAVGEMRDGAAALAYDSAAVLHGLPLFRHRPSAVHLTLPQGARASSRLGLFRHRDELPEEDVVVMAGIRVTAPERTVFDLARSLPLVSAVAAADAALRKVSMNGTRYDHLAAEQWRERMLHRVRRAKGGRGVRQAEQVILFADGRSESAGESAPRVQLACLGFERFALQVAVAGPGGKDYRVDIGVEDGDPFLVEFDGTGKYADEALRAGRSLEQVLLEEKRREDWIRGTTQRRFVRLEDAHTSTPMALAARLAQFGIVLPAGGIRPFRAPQFDR
ncbi:hypothetical protein ACFT30_00060 [Microbacterium ureisolvens]|uniref:hypothetical protein n=1 Tax=Microbacterium ureisolvens TaxID=2781186 RepID=UPI0036333C01